ncbi:MAG: cytidine deaminase [Kofleriaceae bacterium]
MSKPRAAKAVAGRAVAAGAAGHAELVALARAAQAKAYAPYSGFRVGAALVTRTGEVFTGANVENASYGLCICAERNALMAMALAGHRDLAAIVVATDVAPPASPCGMCRQTMLEFAPDPTTTTVTAVGPGAARAAWTVAELIPDGFTGKQLAVKPAPRRR